MVASLAALAIVPHPVAIAGGFLLVPIASLKAVWRLCRRRPLGSGDFRTWLACHELAARRGRLEIDRTPTYRDSELATLLGISSRRARASARRLVAAGLLRWSEANIGLPETPPGPGGPADEVLADSIGSARGTLAIPRRLLRFLARGARPALIATALAALLRCLSRRKAGFDGRGRLKTSWVAAAFEIDPRGVKAARAELVDLGWLMPERSEQAALNRWGRAYRIDLAWAQPGAGAGAQSPPPRAASGAQSPPPDLDQDPLTGMGRDQEPAFGGPVGVEDRQMDGCRMPSQGRPIARPVGGVVRSPRLEDVRPEDLEDAGRLMELHQQAAGHGLVGLSEADRLRFAAAAEHARSVGKSNPCGLFVRIVRRGWWSFATLAEEERAARRLREHGRGGVPGRSTATRSGSDHPPASVGMVLGRLGIGAGPKASGTIGTGPAAGGEASENPWRIAGIRGARALAEVTSATMEGGDAEATMLARLARLMGGASS